MKTKLKQDKAALGRSTTGISIDCRQERSISLKVGKTILAYNTSIQYYSILLLVYYWSTSPQSD